MKPSELANSLRRIAAGIDNSKKPDRRLVAAALKKLLIAAGESSGSIIIHVHGDGEMYDVTQSVSITSNQPFDSLTLPNGDEIIVAKSLADVKSNMDMSDNTLLEALFNANLIESDDNGNFLP
jgi:hypothetical protein